MNAIEILERNSHSEDRCRCTGTARCLYLDDILPMSYRLKDLGNGENLAEELAEERLALMEKSRISLQERSGHTAREARALLARDITAREIEGTMEFMVPELAETHPGMIQEGLERLCMEALDETDWGDGNPPPPWELDRRTIRKDLEKALRDGDAERTLRAYGEIVRIALAIRRIEDELQWEIEEAAEKSLEEFYTLDTSEDQLEWLESLRDLAMAETELETMVAGRHLGNAREILQGCLGWGGDIPGVTAEVRVGITLYTIHQKRHEWEQPGLRLAA